MARRRVLQQRLMVAARGKSKQIQVTGHAAASEPLRSRSEQRSSASQSATKPKSAPMLRVSGASVAAGRARPGKIPQNGLVPVSDDRAAMPIAEYDTRTVATTETPDDDLVAVQPNDPRMMNAHAACLMPCMMNGALASVVVTRAVVAIARWRRIVRIAHIDAKPKSFS